MACRERPATQCWPSYPCCPDDDDSPYPMLGVVTHLTPEMVEDLVTAMAMSNTEYWVVTKPDLEQEPASLIPVTPDFLQSASFSELATQASPVPDTTTEVVTVPEATKKATTQASLVREAATQASPIPEAPTEASPVPGTITEAAHVSEAATEAAHVAEAASTAAHVPEAAVPEAAKVAIVPGASKVTVVSEATKVIIVPVAITAPRAITVAVDATGHQSLVGPRHKAAYFVAGTKPDPMGPGPPCFRAVI